VLNIAKNENPNISPRINTTPEPTTTAARAAPKVFQKFIVLNFYINLVQRYKKVV
jgi:hypothetical protein